MKKTFLLSALAAVTCMMTSCSSDDYLSDGGESDNPMGNVIAFSAKNPNDAAISRATGSTVTSLTGFTVTSINPDNSIFFADEEFTYDAGTFKSTTPHYWPLSSTLSFFAVNDQFSGEYDANNHPVYVASDWDGKKDLLAASVIGGNKQLPYPLTFQHVTSQVKISAEAEDKTEELTYKLVSVKLTAPSTGTYSFASATGGTGTWQIDDEKTSEYSYDDVMPLSFTQNSSVNPTSCYWNILPTTDGKLSFRVEYQVLQNGRIISNFTGDNYKEAVVTNPELKSGKIYTYNLILTRGTNDVITFTTSVSDWTANSVSNENVYDPSLTYVTYTDGTTKTFQISGSIPGGTNGYGYPGTTVFGTQSSIKSIRLSNQVTTIKPFAFSKFSALESIYIPSSVTSIGEGAFMHCESLKVGYVPTCMKEIPANLFEGCKAMETVTFAEDITSIGHGAFNCCQSLKTFTVPNTVTEIGNQALGYCYNMETITLSKNLERIGKWAFIGNKSLRAITVPAENTHYASVDGVLYSGAKDTLITVPMMKTGSLTLPSTVKVIIEKAGEDSHLTSLSIPDGVELGDFAFTGADYLETITFGANCKIGTNAFRQNQYNKSEANLKSVTFNGKVTFGGYAVFWGCTKLSTITYNSTEAPEFDTSVITSNYNGWSSTTATNAIGYDTRSAGTNMFYVPAGATFTEGDLEMSKAVIFDSNYGGFTLSKSL